MNVERKVFAHFIIMEQYFRIGVWEDMELIYANITLCVTITQKSPKKQCGVKTKQYDFFIKWFYDVIMIKNKRL